MRSIRPIPLDQLRAEVLAIYRPPARSRASFLKVRQTFNLLAQLGCVETTADLTGPTVAAFLESRPPGESPGTTRGLLAFVRVICNYSAEEGYAPTSPFYARRRWLHAPPPTPPRSRPTLTIGAVGRVLRSLEAEADRSWFNARLHAAAAVAAYTGLRKREVLTLRVEAVDLKARLLSVAGGRGAPRPVPLAPPLAKILARWLPRTGPAWVPCVEPRFAFPSRRGNRPWDGGRPGYGALDQLKAAGRRAGVEGFTFDALRRSWATFAATSWQIPPTAIGCIARRSRPQAWRGLTAADLVRLAERIRFDIDAPGPGDGGGPP